MGKPVSLELKGQRLVSEVTDSDLIFFLGIFFLTAEERDLIQRSGSEKVLKSLAARQKMQLDEAIADELRARGVTEVTEEIQKAAEESSQKMIGEALIHRINFDGYVRVEAAQRFTEIFPDINPNTVYFEDRIDQKGDRTRRGRIRLETQELLDLVLAVLSTDEEVKQETSVAPPQEIDVKKAIAEVQHARPQIIGFESTAKKSDVIPAPEGTVDAELAALMPHLSNELKAKLNLPVS